MARTRSWWRRIDVRGVVGGILVVAAIAGTWLTVQLMQPSGSYAVATTTLVPGDTVRDGDLRFEAVAVGTAAAQYLQEGSGDVVGRQVTETVVSGELVPRRVLQDRELSGMARVMINSAAATPTAVASGSRVDLWRSADADTGDEASLLVRGARVVAVDDARRFAATDDQRSVEVLIDEDAVADVVSAQGERGGITIVQSGQAAP